MMPLLAENPPIDEETSALWYALIVLIMAIGIAGMLLMIGIIVTRRLSRRWQMSIEQDIEERRSNKTPTDDVWSKSAQRYVDPDALSDQERAEREAGTTDDIPDGFETEGDEAENDSPESEDEDDPYGLFRDKPYVEPDDDADDFEPDEDEDDRPF